ncbi:MAG: glycoside hydrolase family 3 protein [Campylobacter sp.]|nr:glycoside hydrolase family 3 protein [Campylobacter sp.]
MRFFLLFLLFFVELTASEPSLRHKIAQMIMVGFEGSSISEKNVKVALSDAKYNRFGGVILLGRNVSDRENLKALCDAFKQRNSKIFIAIDEEGGKVSRLKNLGYDFKSAYKIGSTQDIMSAKKSFEKLAKALKSYGINLNFAPVVDIHYDASPIIGQKERSFGRNGTKVSIYADAFIDAMNEQKIISVLKHFPGHGNSKQDSHKNLAYTKLEKDALKPYMDAISFGKAQVIMVGHLIVSDIDENNPATFSYTILHRLLREELGFKGVVISDDMMMQGSGKTKLKDKIIKFINGGGDILLFSDFYIGERKTAELVTQHIVDAVNEKRIDEAKIHKAYERIMQLKQRL